MIKFYIKRFWKSTPGNKKSSPRHSESKNPKDKKEFAKEEQQISEAEEKMLREAWKQTKRRLPPSEKSRQIKSSLKDLNKGQIGFSGIKGKDSINPRFKQPNLQETIKEAERALKYQNLLKTSPIRQEKEEHQLDLGFDLNRTDRPFRRHLVKRMKKEKEVAWVPYKDIRYHVSQLTDKKIPLSGRSQEVWDWLHSLDPKKLPFKKGCVPLNIAEFKGFLKGFNRKQCTELFYAYLSIHLFIQPKNQFALKEKKNFISHFGFNNCYNYMSWTFKQRALMQKVITRANSLYWVKLLAVKKRIHEQTKKIYYMLEFKALNKWSKELTKPEKRKVYNYIRKNYLSKGRSPPKCVPFFGLDFKALQKN